MARLRADLIEQCRQDFADKVYLLRTSKQKLRYSITATRGWISKALSPDLGSKMPYVKFVFPLIGVCRCRATAR